MDTVILIPAYRPSEELLPFVKALREEALDVVVVDDGGGAEYDGIFGALESCCHVIRYQKNRGKGSAMKTGFKYIRETMPDCKYIVTADADGQHRIPDILNVVKALREDGADSVIIGARHFENKVPLRSRMGNIITRSVFALLTGVRITDTQTGLRGFHASQLGWLESVGGDRYEYEMNMLMSAAELKIPLHEIKIETVYENDNSSSHFRVVKDSFRIYKTIFLASTSLKFLFSSCLAFAVDYILFLVFGGVLKATVLAGNDPLRILVATLCAWIISSLTNYTVNRKFVFRKKDEGVRSFVGYYSLAGVVYVTKLGIIELLSVIIGVPEWISKLIAEVALFISNYFIQKKLIFRKGKR